MQSSSEASAASQEKSQRVAESASTPSAEEVARGHAIYTPFMLSVYDVWVLGISSALVWRCPAHRLLEHYGAHLRDHHLEAGVGTGYMLDHTRFHGRKPRITLLDINPSTLAYGSRRLRRYAPRTQVANLLEPFDLGDKFDSVSLNLVLHCLPGTMESKSIAFDHLKRNMAPGAVLFGSTVLGRGIEHSTAAKKMIAFYNAKGIFSNTQDDPDGLARALAERFGHYRIEIVGSVALFVASV